MLFFWKKSEYEIMWQTYVEIMLILKSKPTLEIEKICKIDWFNLYFLTLIFAIIESWIIHSKYQISKIKCNMFDVEKLVKDIFQSDFYSKKLYYSKDNQEKYVEELSEFIYDNLLLFYDKFTYNDIDYIPTEKEKQTRKKLISKWINTAFNNKLIPTDAHSFVNSISDRFYRYSQFGEKTNLKDFVIKYLENIYEK